MNWFLRRAWLPVMACLSLPAGAQDPNQQVNLFAIPTMSASFIRMPARDASQEIDGVYYNPAGLTSLDNGFTLEVNNQFQITSFNMLAYNRNLNESPADYSYYPVNYAFPTIFGAYKRNRFAFSFGVFPAVGGGGATSIGNLPSVEFPVADAAVVSRNIITLVESLYENDRTYTDFRYEYDFDSRGIAFSPGFQVGLSFKLNEYISLALAGRFIYYVVDQEGGLSNLRFVNEDRDLALSPGEYFQYMAEQEAETYSAPITLPLPGPLPDVPLPVSGADVLNLTGTLFGELLGDQQVDVIQSSAGVTPIVGLNFNYHGRWYIGLKYEHRTYINLITKITDGKDGMGLYVEGKEVRADLPGFLSSGVQFRPNDRVTLSAGNRLFFNKRANLNGREQYIKSLYKEYALGAEYKLFPRFALSGGVTYRTVRYEDAYYTDVDYYLPAWTFAGGFKSEISRRISVEAGFLTTLYEGRTFYKDYDFFGGQLALVGAELPQPLAEALQQRIKYEVDGKAFVAAVGINFWMGNLEQNRRDRRARVESLKERRQYNRDENKLWIQDRRDQRYNERREYREAEPEVPQAP